MSTNSNFSGSPQSRWEEGQRALDALDPVRDFSKTLVRNSQGELVQIDRGPVVNERVDEATWNRMTYPEKVAYAARMSGQK